MDVTGAAHIGPVRHVGQHSTGFYTVSSGEELLDDGRPLLISSSDDEPVHRHTERVTQSQSHLSKAQVMVLHTLEKDIRIAELFLARCRNNDERICILRTFQWKCTCIIEGLHVRIAYQQQVMTRENQNI
eukprot:4764169-Karenia_brevis.AAC.1